MSVSEECRLAARELMRTWRAQPQVSRYWDEPERTSVDIAVCENSPWEGITGVGTLGLSEHSLGFAPLDLRVELVGAFPASAIEFPNLVSTCAFNIIKEGWPARPGGLHPNVMAMYDLSSTLHHVMLVDPFLWEDGPATLELPQRTIAWLMIVPISESELRFAETAGPDALSGLFEQHSIDIVDLNRVPVV